MATIVFYRQATLKLVCNRSQNPGKPDAFDEVRSFDMSHYVSTVKQNDSHCECSAALREVSYRYL